MSDKNAHKIFIYGPILKNLSSTESLKRIETETVHQLVVQNLDISILW